MSDTRYAFRGLPALLAACAVSGVVGSLGAQPGSTTRALGTFYRLEEPDPFVRSLAAVRIERFAPPALAPPGPIEPIGLPRALRSLTDLVLELPDRQVLFFAGVDGRGFTRLVEIDLIRREAREVVPSQYAGAPYAVRARIAPDGSKLYVQWLGPGGLEPHTDIYDGALLSWIGRTAEFQADLRALEFEHRPPYLWTFDYRDRLVLVDTDRDRVVRTVDPRAPLGSVQGEVVDAWRDLLLVRESIDRYRVVDVGSGEVGPTRAVTAGPRDLARLVGGGRFLIHLEVDRRVTRHYPGRPTATVTGNGSIHDIRSGDPVGEFHLALAPDVPHWALGTEPDPTTGSRLWVYGPGDRQRFELKVPPCDGRAPPRAEVRPVVDASWNAERSRYRYSLTLDGSDRGWAFALEAGLAVQSARRPDGWGTDRIDGDRWIRWTNGLGPPDENIGPAPKVFVVEAKPETRPGLVEARVQAEIGLARGCERGDRFLENSTRAWTIGPERVPREADELAGRLQTLTGQVCDLDWLDGTVCTALRDAADAARRALNDGRAAEAMATLEAFQSALEGAGGPTSVIRLLEDAAAAVTESRPRSSP